MAKTEIVGGPRDGTYYHCACPQGACECDVFGCGAENGNRIRDGYILLQQYRRVGGVFQPDCITKQVMIVEDGCPRCDRPMPKGTEWCLNCGACMGVDFNANAAEDE